MASVSDRVDAQTGVLDRVNKTATEARQAAFAARSQTDPQKYGELVGETIDGKINDNLVRMARMITDLRHATNATGETLQKAERYVQAGAGAGRKGGSPETRSSVAWSGCCRSGSCPDDCPSAFLRQQRCHMRCAWGRVDQDNKRG